MSDVRFATSNMFKRLDAAQSLRHVSKVTAEADVVVWQECTRTHRRTLKALPGWSHYFAGSGMAISWRTDRFRIRRDARWRAVVRGIRSVDPARGFADVVLEDLDDGTLWPILCTHMTHQAFTSHPERWPRWRYQAYRLYRRSRRLKRRWGRMLGGGDVNRHRWAPKGTEGAWPNEGTLGGKNYDVTFHKGAARRTGPARAIHTPSDHDTVVTPYRST